MPTKIDYVMLNPLRQGYPMTDYVLDGLAKRRAELIADAKAADATLRRLLDDIAHIDGAIRIYDPTYRPRKVRLTRAQYVGTMRTALTILRSATAPMTLRDITLRVIAEQGRDQGDALFSRRDDKKRCGRRDVRAGQPGL